MLCVLFKIFERIIYARVEPIIDTLLPKQQAGFRHGRSSVDQVTLLTQDIEDSFSAKKAGAVFVDLTAAYDTVWHRGLTCKLPQLLYLIDKWSAWSWRWLAIAASPLPPEMANGTGYDASRTASHRNLSWHPFSSTSTSLTCQPSSPQSMHMPISISIHECWQSSNHARWWRLAGSGRVLSKDMATVGEYLQTWDLRLSTTKTRFLTARSDAMRRHCSNWISQRCDAFKS